MIDDTCVSSLLCSISINVKKGSYFLGDFYGLYFKNNTRLINIR